VTVPGAPAGGRLRPPFAPRCVAFEDWPVGSAAEAAGLWVVGVPSLAGTVLDAADVVIPSLAVVDPRDLLTAPGGPGAGR